MKSNSIEIDKNELRDILGAVIKDMSKDKEYFNKRLKDLDNKKHILGEMYYSEQYQIAQGLLNKLNTQIEDLTRQLNNI